MGSEARRKVHGKKSLIYPNLTVHTRQCFLFGEELCQQNADYQGGVRTRGIQTGSSVEIDVGRGVGAGQ